MCYSKGMTEMKTPAPRRGRPPKPIDEVLAVALPAVRLTAGDMREARHYANRHGIGLSEYVRRAVENMNARERSLDVQ